MSLMICNGAQQVENYDDALTSNGKMIVKIF